jgi:hypothetical protein
VASLNKDILSLLTDEQLETLDGWLLVRKEREDSEGLQRVHKHRVDKGWRYDEDGVLRAPWTGRASTTRDSGGAAKHTFRFS